MTQIGFWQLVKLTARDPLEAGRIVRHWPASREALVLATALIAVVIAMILAVVQIPIEDGSAMQMGLPMLLIACIGMFVGFTVQSFFEYFIPARLFSGTGTFDQAWKHRIWLFIWSLLIVIPFIVLSAILGGFGATGMFFPFIIAMAIWMFWIQVSFLAALHDFKNRLLVFLGLVGFSILFQLLVGMIGGLLGVAA
ncbi:hypothetical protein ACMA5I_11760 [Paracoccaceae bacterium GXU_MW_L88]